MANQGQEIGSKDVAVVATKMAISVTREEENAVKTHYTALGIRCCAVDFGGEFITSVNKIVERAVVSAKREGVIGDTHMEEGATAGATREALSGLVMKAIGSNVGGKIGIARKGDHVVVVLFFGIGLLHLNEIAISMGHRAI